MSRPLSVLIVEAEPLLAGELQSNIKEKGAVVVVARSIAAAESAISVTNFDLCVLDPLAWDSSAHVVAPLLRLRKVPFIIYSMVGSPPAGAIAHIRKPRPSHVVVRAVLKNLATQRATVQELSRPQSS